MSWLDEDWSNRHPVAVNHSTGTSSYYAEIAIDPTFTDFWASVDSSGDDIRVTEADGRTLVPYEVIDWNYAAKTATVLYGSVNTTTGRQSSVNFLYWGNASATNAESTIAPLAPGVAKQAYILYVALSPLTPVFRSPALIGSRPSGFYTMVIGWEGWIAFDVTDSLFSLTTPHEGHTRLEEVQAITVQTTESGSNYAGGYDANNTAITETNNAVLIWMWVKGGSSGTSYVDRVTIETTKGRSFVYSAVRTAYTPEE